MFYQITCVQSKYKDKKNGEMEKSERNIFMAITINGIFSHLWWKRVIIFIPLTVNATQCCNCRSKAIAHSVTDHRPKHQHVLKLN